MDNQEIRDRIIFSDYLSERGRQDGGHASGNGPYPMRGDMTSEEYIIRLLQTIESLNSTMMAMREEIAFLRESLAKMEASLSASEQERKRQQAIINAKDEDLRKLTHQMADLLGKVAALTNALEDKSHQLSARNRNQFGTKTNRTKANKNTEGRDDDHDDYSASADTKSEQQEASAQPESEETKPLETPKSDLNQPIDLDEFKDKFGKERPDNYEHAHADRVIKFECDRSQVRGEIIGETVCSVFNQVSYVEERQYVFITSVYEEEVLDPHTGKVIDYVTRQETKHYPMKEDLATEGAAQETVVRMDRLPGMIGGHFMTAEMIADIVFQYLVCFTPLNRQANALKEDGFVINRQTVTEIYHSVGYLLEPVYKALQKKVMSRNAFLNCDETWFRLHFKDGNKKGYIWVMANKELDSMFYFYDDGSRAREVLQIQIESTEIKAIMSDGYVAYKHLDAEDSKVEHLADLCHIRTKFMDWLQVAPDEDAADMIRDFNELFRRERYYRNQEEWTPKQIEDARTGDESMEILTRIANRLDMLDKRKDKENEGIPKVGERAINYMKNLWASVLKWCRDGRYSLDNNLAERCCRPVALLRKNIVHFSSHKGAEVFSIFGSLIESCKMAGVSIKQYLVKVIKEIDGGNKDCESLLPGVLSL